MIKPIGSRVVIKRIEEEKKTPSGIFIPDNSKTKPIQGEVVAVGVGAVSDQGVLIPLSVQVGDKVYFGKYSGTEIKVDEQEFLIMKEEEILGVL